MVRVQGKVGDVDAEDSPIDCGPDGSSLLSPTAVMAVAVWCEAVHRYATLGLGGLVGSVMGAAGVERGGNERQAAPAGVSMNASPAASSDADTAVVGAVAAAVDVAVAAVGTSPDAGPPDGPSPPTGFSPAVATLLPSPQYLKQEPRRPYRAQTTSRGGPSSGPRPAACRASAAWSG